MAFDLEEALQRFPLPDGLTDVTLNLGQCATALNVSPPRISAYLQQGLPVLSRGSNGKEYEFRLSEVHAWKRWDEAEKQRRVDEAEQNALQHSLLFRNLDEDDEGSRGLTAAEIAQEADADYKRNKAAELRGELTRTSRVREVFEEVLAEFRNQVTTLVDFAELEFGLKPDQVDKMQRRCDAALVAARHNLDRAYPAAVEPINRAEHRA